VQATSYGGGGGGGDVVVTAYFKTMSWHHVQELRKTGKTRMDYLHWTSL